jgi:hypothetical protein|tara:strand:+ start:866 stop:1240 length:375 start_codon:yes stop_codon:yes gene_type:complete
MYKIGDKVRVLSTDYSEIQVGEIKEVVEAIKGKGVYLPSSDGDTLYFYNSELEPYIEDEKELTDATKCVKVDRIGLAATECVKIDKVGLALQILQLGHTNESNVYNDLREKAAEVLSRSLGDEK